ncbi:reverse transcriptase domain-containing protein [Tanacetum coccineum]
MFCQTLRGATRNWLDDLDPKNVDSFKELSQKFLEEFSQQKRSANDPTEIRGIKRRQNDGIAYKLSWSSVFKSDMFTPYRESLGSTYLSFYAWSWSSGTCKEAQ